MVYEGNVKLTQETSRLTAKQVEIRLDPAGGQVETLIARGEALFTAPDREAEGEVIEYRASDGRILVEGGRRPARARQKESSVVGGTLEMTPAGVRVVASPTGRTRGRSNTVQAPEGSRPASASGPKAQ